MAVVRNFEVSLGQLLNNSVILCSVICKLFIFLLNLIRLFSIGMITA
jgi:hypothetical protein